VERRQTRSSNLGFRARARFMRAIGMERAKDLCAAECRLGRRFLG